MRAPAQPERLGAGLVRASAGRRYRGRAARAAPRDAADVVRRGLAAARRAGPGRRRRRPDVPPDRHRRIGGGRDPGRGDAPPRRPGGRDVRPARGRRRPGERGRGRTRRDERASDRVEAAAAVVRERLGDHIWAEGDTTWADAVGGRLEARGWRLAVEEVGTAGQVAALFGDAPWLALSRVRPGPTGRRDTARTTGSRLERPSGPARRLASRSAWASVRDLAGRSSRSASRSRRPPAIASGRTTTYIGGAMGRSQSALLAAATLFEALGER